MFHMKHFWNPSALFRLQCPYKTIMDINRCSCYIGAASENKIVITLAVSSVSPIPPNEIWCSASLEYSSHVNLSAFPFRILPI